MKNVFFRTLGLLLMGASFSSFSIAGEFPLRTEYLGLTPISTERLAELYTSKQLLVVDVRSKFEYETIHVKGAINIALAKRSFVNDLEAVRPKDSAKPLVFYCNGTTCAKSYRATKAAQDAGFKNCYVYDAGIFTWTKSHPEWAVLLDSSPADPQKLISTARLKEKTLSVDVFQTEASKPNSVVIDIRDPIQRKVRLDFSNERNIPLDRFQNLLRRGDMKDKKLLIYDAVGKQVRWLMYHLEQHGYTNYAFLDGGVRKANRGKTHS